MVPVGKVDVPMLELRGCGQNDVRPIGRVGLKVLEDDREKILTCQSTQNCIAVWSDRRRIGVVDDDCANWGSADAGVVSRQRLAEPDHVDRTDGRGEIGTLECLFIELEIGARRELYAATGTSPVAGDRRQTC